MYEAYDPYDKRWRLDPYPVYRELRDERPVHYASNSKSWCVSRYEDVEYVFRHPELFSSKTQQFLIPAEGRSLLSGLRLAARFMWQMKVGPRSMRGSRMLIQEDGDIHTTMRAFVNRGFTPRNIARLEKRISEIVATCMDEMRGRDSFDLVSELNVPLPVTVIAEMLGVEPERRRQFKTWSDNLIQSASNPEPGRVDELLDTMAEMRAYLQPIVDARRANPTDDLISTLVATEGEGALSDFEVFFFVLLLLVAGNETTTNLIGNAVDALLEHPDVLERVRADPGLIPAMIEETLRWDSPIQSITRRCERDLELAGTHIPADAKVMVLLGSANRDERRFADPDRFDLGRDTRGHLAFAIGKHFCLGASLARLEARVALEALVPELGQLTRLRPEREFVDSFIIRGPSRLELRRAG
ncbi:MAG: cytochrome P450 [Myxococcota bacterium]